MRYALLAVLILLCACRSNNDTRPAPAPGAQPKAAVKAAVKDGIEPAPSPAATLPGGNQDTEQVLQTKEPAAPAEGTEGKGEDMAQQKPQQAKSPIDLDKIRAGIAKFAPVVLEYEESRLTPVEKAVIQKLIQAANAVDIVFWKQASSIGIELRQSLQAEDSEEARTLLHYLLLNYGPWDRLSDFVPFVGDKQKPLGAAFYPEDLTREEFNAWIKAHPADEQSFKSGFTVIRRGPDKSLIAVPYSVEYSDNLTTAYRLLKDAAFITEDKGLATYLEARAEALITNDYYKSDLLWMDLDSRIEITIGPYEVYEDRLFGYKTAFEAFVTFKDAAATKTLATFEEWAPKLEALLPLDKKYLNSSRGTESPIAVVDLIYSAGDTRAGVQTIAFNLPNDERVRAAKGSKKVLLRNVIYAKFQKILTPIAARTVDPDTFAMLNREAFFHHTLMHEISHGLGPGSIRDENGKDTTVGQALAELYSHIEEAKADVLGLHNNLILIEKAVEKLADGKGGFLSAADAAKATMATYLAGIFRSIRFGTEEAHGKANLMQLAYLMERGVISVGATGRYVMDFEAAPAAIRDLAAQLLEIEARGDYEAARGFLGKYGQMPEGLRPVLDGLAGVPVDIEPLYRVPTIE